MTNSIYCTYLTVYYGNKLPPFYIGSTSIEKIKSGYHGSVKSKQYSPIWKDQLLHHPELFKTFIISKHDTRTEAMEKEQFFQTQLNVVRSSLYINKATANGTFFTDGPLTEETKQKMSKSRKGRIFSQSTREKMSQSQKGRYCSEETKKKLSEMKKGKKIHSEETKRRISEMGKGRPGTKGRTGQKHKEESLQKMRDAYKNRQVPPGMQGKHHSEETKKKIADAQRGVPRKPHTDEWKGKMSKLVEFTDPDGNVYIHLGINDFCLKHNLNNAHIGSVLHGRTSHHKGWTARYV